MTPVGYTSGHLSIFFTAYSSWLVLAAFSTLSLLHTLCPPGPGCSTHILLAPISKLHQRFPCCSPIHFILAPVSLVHLLLTAVFVSFSWLFLHSTFSCLISCYPINVPWLLSPFSTFSWLAVDHQRCELWTVGQPLCREQPYAVYQQGRWWLVFSS